MTLRKLPIAIMTCTVLFLFSLGATAAPNGEVPTKHYWSNEIGDPLVYEFPFLSCDGFDVIIHVEFSGWWMVHPETPGKHHWEMYFSFSGMRVFNEYDPDLFVDGVPGGKWNRRWRGTPGDSNAVETGVQLMLTIPYYGVIYRDVGRIEIDWDTVWPVFYAGHWDAFDGPDEDLVALCAVLAE